MENSEPLDDSLQERSAMASVESAIEDVPGAPTWPIQPPGNTGPTPPPVGLNWGAVSLGLGIDLDVLKHEGIIVLTGQYFPESGFFFDPVTLRGQHVDVGDIAIRHGYFLGNMTTRDFPESFPLLPKDIGTPGIAVIRQARGPVIGLFSDRRAAQRAKTAVMQGALGAGVRLEDGPLGCELTVLRPELPGTVATIIASYAGAVISVGGEPVATSEVRGAMSTAPSLPAAEADTWRPGTGSAGDSQAASREVGSSEEFPRL